MALADLITTLRALAQDAPASKYVPREELTADPTTPADGVNKYFRLKSVPVVGTDSTHHNVFITVVGTNYRTQAGFTVDLVTGIVTFTAAPTSGVTIIADYNYYWFSDAQHTQFLNEAAGNLLLSASPDPTTVVQGLVPAMMQYALGNLLKARASQYAERYATSGSDASQSVDAVAKVFLALARGAEKRGDELRDSYYKKQGQGLTPAYNMPKTQPPPAFDPIAPRR